VRDEREEIGVNVILRGRAHSVRRPGIDLEYGILNERYRHARRPMTGDDGFARGVAPVFI
jgi:hypothetical protein